VSGPEDDAAPVKTGGDEVLVVFCVGVVCVATKEAEDVEDAEDAEATIVDDEDVLSPVNVLLDSGALVDSGVLVDSVLVGSGVDEAWVELPVEKCDKVGTEVSAEFVDDNEPTAFPL